MPDPDFQMTSNELIVALRGGIPVKCDFCGQPMKPSDAIPEEAGDWACRTCWDRWEARAQQEHTLHDNMLSLDGPL